MAFKPEIERKPLRLRGYNYKNAGLYYVTLCTQNRLCLFGEISNHKMILNEPGKMLYNIWSNISNYYSNVKIDEFIIMPDHIHAIIVISYINPEMKTSLSNIIKNIKTYSTLCYIQGIKKYGWTNFEKRLWQRSFHERIIRDPSNLIRIRKYIIDNPLNWKEQP